MTGGPSLSGKKQEERERGGKERGLAVLLGRVTRSICRTVRCTRWLLAGWAGLGSVRSAADFFSFKTVFSFFLFWF
jgi:hypothetical protein